jgi:hypothetical protein
MTEVYIHSMYNCQTYTDSKGVEFINKLIRVYDPSLPNNEGDPILFVRYVTFKD